MRILDRADYYYRAKIVRWVDGDTVDLDIDLGFYVSVKVRCRLLGIDTPERGRKNWAEATAAANRMAPVDSSVEIFSRLPADKYGRFLVTIFTQDSDVTVNQRLIDAGLAVPYDGGKKA